ncbi:MAG: GIY-YIG nuclease family protein [Betaproteobacteria bacterium]|nr:GIY-YIG nuclease family protein [Betaproteobacteria bacterium]
MWYLYLIECRNGALYAGITTDVDARYHKHQQGKGARYTRANPPQRLIGSRAFADRSSAAKAEWAIKQLPRENKIDYLNQSEPVANPIPPGPAQPPQPTPKGTPRANPPAEAATHSPAKSLRRKKAKPTPPR